MQSSTSSPFELTYVHVEKHATLDPMAKRWMSGAFARYIFVDTARHNEVPRDRVMIGVSGVVELASESWLNDFGPGTALRIGNVRAAIALNEDELRVDPKPYSNALWFACEQLNPMLDTFTTLFGIEHNIDIQVEHRLRPVERLLQNLIMPAAARATYNRKHKTWGIL